MGRHGMSICQGSHKGLACRHANFGASSLHKCPMYILKRAIQKEMLFTSGDNKWKFHKSIYTDIRRSLFISWSLGTEWTYSFGWVRVFFLCRIAERPFKEDAEKGNFSLLQWHERQGTSWDMFMRFTILLWKKIPGWNAVSCRKEHAF